MSRASVLWVRNLRDLALHAGEQNWASARAVALSGARQNAHLRGRPAIPSPYAPQPPSTSIWDCQPGLPIESKGPLRPRVLGSQAAARLSPSHALPGAPKLGSLLSVPGARITGGRVRGYDGGMGMESTFVWPRGATPSDMFRLESWLAACGWEVDPTVYMAGAGGAAVQVRRIDAAWADGETGLLILPAETVLWDGTRMRIAPSAAARARCTTS